MFKEKISRSQLSDRTMVFLVAMLAAFPAVSTDLYLPALPTMSEQLSCSVAMVNLSLILFFALLSLSAIIWGPMSDKYGRKKILLIGVPLYLISSIACALSQTIYQLLAARVFQAIGSGAAMAVNLAIVKDFFPGKKREQTIAMISVLTGMVPVVAPVIGGQIIKYTSWRGSFVALSFIGALAWFFVLFYKETNQDLSNLSIFRSTLRLLVVLRNMNFTRLLIIFSIISVPILGFISISSFIFIRRFGVAEEVFGFYFGSVAILFVVGGPIYLFLQKHFKPVTIITTCFFVSTLSGILLLTIGGRNPILFVLSVACSYIAVSISRPPSNSLMLEQQDKDTGSASSLLYSSFMVSGSLGMLIVSYDWSDRIVVLGIISLVAGIGGLFLWLYSKTRCRMPQHFF